MTGDRWFRRLLQLYPPDFRDRFGFEIQQAFREAERGTRGLGRVWFFLRVALDLVRTGCVAWFSVIVHTARLVRGKDGFVERLFQDLRFSIRTLRKRPGFTLVVVATLALGIGANTAIFTMVNEILLRSLPIGNADDVVDIFAEVTGGNSFTGFSFGDYVDYRDRNDVLVDLAAFSGVRVDVGRDDDVSEASAQLSSANYFDVLQVTPALGRAFSSDEGVRGGGSHVAVISHGYWERRTGRDPAVIGSTIHVNDVPMTVVGVAPPGFEGTFIGFPMEMWIPLSAAEGIIDNMDLDDRGSTFLEFIGRRKPGVTISQVHGAFDLIAEQLEAEYPVTNRGRSVGVAATTGVDHSMRTGVTAFLGVLTGVALVVLLVTCLNVSGMMLARSTGRQKEITIRLAVGAGRWRLVRQLLTEAALLFALGGIGGAFVASRLTDGLLLLVARLPVPLGFHLPLDWRVLLYTASMALATALLAGAFPARELLRQDPATALRARDDDRRTGRLRQFFVIGQVAGAVVLLVGGGLFARSLQEGLRVDLGFDADRVAVTTVTLPEEEYDANRADLFFAQLRTRMQNIPGIESVTFASRRPIAVGRNPVEIDVPGFEKPTDVPMLVVDANMVDDAYLGTLGIDVISGRAFRSEDLSQRHNVVVVNSTMANRFWPGRNPVGQQVNSNEQQYTVVGVADDSRYLIQDDTPMSYLYFPASVRFTPSRQLILRSAGDPRRFNTQLQVVITELDPSLTPPQLMTVRESMNAALLPQRVAAAVTGSLGLFGFFLAALGVYGILAHAVARRAREIGVRMALGGRQTTVLRMVVGDGMRLVLAGVLAGVVISLVLMPLVASFLVQVRPYDPVTFVGVSLLFTVIASVACFLPARRATRIDPVTVLRND